jgi:hypothetical protein
MGQAKRRKEQLGAEYGRFVQRQPTEPQFNSMFLDVEFGNPLDIHDANQVMGNALDLQLNLTAAQIGRCKERVEFELENVRRAMFGQPALVRTQRAVAFAVPFGKLTAGQQDHDLQVINLRENLTLEQLHQCESDLLFHQETIKLAKLLSDRGTVTLDLSALTVKGSHA